MTFLILLYVFILGTAIGSFLNVCVYRLPFGKSILKPPSTCGNCQTRLNAKDLVPILSWVFLKGKCGYCSSKISARYPLVEGLTGFLFVLTYLSLGLGLKTIFGWVLLSYALVLALIDVDHHKIHNGSVLIGLLLGLTYRMVDFLMTGSFDNFISGLLGMVLGFSVMLLLAMVSRVFKGAVIGLGDVKIYLPIGLILGLNMTLISIWLMFLISGIFALIYLLFKKSLDKNKALPLGPMIMISMFGIWLWSVA